MSDYDAYDDREVISEADARELQRMGVLAMDPERALPLWFDGRYLTASDLNREQNYFLSRQTAIGKAVGRGVIEGLEVAVDTAGAAEGSRLLIGAGQGIAFDGAHVLLPQDLPVNLADLAVQDALNARLGLSATPGASARGRSGLFVLSLRAVEYTANRTASFPTHVDGERTTHMGDRVEAVAVTLTPFAPLDAPLDAVEARAMAAQRIFQGAEETGAPAHALPIAMLALRAGSVEWVDMHMVRRDLVASRRAFLGLGLSRDQLRLAHFNQYQAELGDLIRVYLERGQPARFNAEQHFRLLPAAGPLPAACVDPAAQTQLFFPGEVDVELSIVPDDELPALIDDSFELPPIDLTRPPEEREGLSVMVLAPLPRRVMRSQLRHLGALSRPLKPISLLGQGPQKPIDKLGAMRIALADVAAAIDAEQTPTTGAWAALIRDLSSFGAAGDAAVPLLWYVRRRTLRENVDLESALAAVDHIDADTDVEEPVEPDPATPDPGTPDPDAPETPDPPEPRPEEEFSEDVQRVLIQLAGFGDLAEIAKAQFRRLNAPVAEAYLAGLTTPQIRGFPLSVTALTVRISQLRANEAAKARRAVESLAGANVIGLRLLGSGLLGEGGVRITAARFKELSFFLGTEDMLEQTAEAAAKLGAARAGEMIVALRKAVQSGIDAAVKEAASEIAAAASRPERPAEPSREDNRPVAPDPAEERRRRLEEARERREAAAKARADAQIQKIPDKEQQKKLAVLFDNADPRARDSLVVVLEGAGVERSRIAVGNVLHQLSGSARVEITNLSRIRHVDKEFVGGLAALEPFLLKPPQPPEETRRTATSTATTGGRAASLSRGANLSRSAATLQPRATINRAVLARTIDTSRLSVLVNAAGAQTVARRVQMLASNAALRALAAFGHENARNRANLNKVADQVVTALDARGATANSVQQTILRAVRSVG